MPAAVSPSLRTPGRAALEQIQITLGHASIQTTERYLGVRRDLSDAPCDHLGLDLGSKLIQQRKGNMTMINRKEFEICKRRGHEVGLSGEWSQCRACGVWVREVTTMEEREDSPPKKKSAQDSICS